MLRLDLRPAGNTSRRGKLGTQVLAAAMVSCWTFAAAARSNGTETDSCAGCHTNAGDVTATLVASPANFEPGATVDFTLVLKRPGLNRAGFYISTSSGTPTPGTGARLGTYGTSILHSSPATGDGESATIRFKWQAPSDPGGLDVWVSAVAANGDGRASGDDTLGQNFSFVYGCAGVPVFQDLDRDAVGSSEYGTSLRCASEEGWAELDGDCNENNATIHPGAIEICNGRDDDCNGEIDDGIDLATVYRDADMDGYGAGQSLATMGGCDTSGDFANRAGDCDDTDPEVFVEAEELCNEKDDNCDGRVDEGVRPRCGVGRCQSLAYSCASDDCVPGRPEIEVCNLLDDDCDGEVDEASEALCASGVCRSGVCSSDANPPAPTASAVNSASPQPPSTGSSAASSSAIPQASAATGTPPPATAGTSSAAPPGGSAPLDPINESAPDSAGCSVYQARRQSASWCVWLPVLLGLFYRRNVRRVG